MSILIKTGILIRILINILGFVLTRNKNDNKFCVFIKEYSFYSIDICDVFISYAKLFGIVLLGIACYIKLLSEAAL